MKKILITGSQSYIGSVLADYLEQRGFEVVGYDLGLFQDCLLFKAPPARTFIKDVRAIDKNDLRGIAAVVHLAGISNDPFGSLDPAQVYDPTRAYTERLAKLCKELGVRFIFSSSCSVYGRAGAEALAEDGPVNPQTPYSLNKVQIEDDLKVISDRNFSPIALRLATVFGLSPRMRFDVVINMLAGMALTSKKIVLNSDGTPWRPNVHILDVCEAIRRGLDSEYSGGQLLVLNVGADENNLQVSEIARLIQEQLPGCELKFLSENPKLDEGGLISDRKVRGGIDNRTYKVSFAKIKKQFPGFSCAWTVKRGIQDLLAGLTKIGLTEVIFKDIKFYRLQKLDDLFKRGLISATLQWRTSQQSSKR